MRLLLLGDLILDEPDPDGFFEPSHELLGGADLVVGHVEVPHTSRGVPSSVDIPAPPADPAHLAALARAGIGVATLAGNHIFDSGPAGVEDTIAELRRLGIATTGAGMNIDEARAPAIVDAAGVRVGVLSYNCVGPRESRATSRKAGCAPLDVLTHYELDYAGPGGPPRIYTFVTPESNEVLRADVAGAPARPRTSSWWRSTRGSATFRSSCRPTSGSWRAPRSTAARTSSSATTPTFSAGSSSIAASRSFTASATSSRSRTL